MYVAKAFIPKVTSIEVQNAIRDYPFLALTHIPLVEDVITAAGKAVSETNRALRTQSCVSEVISKTYDENRNGWEIEMKILD